MLAHASQAYRHAPRITSTPRVCACALHAVMAIALAIALPFMNAGLGLCAYAAQDDASSAAASTPTTAQDPSAAADPEDEEEGNLIDPTQRADNSFIYDTTIESLFDQASLYEGNTVQVVGEVVGDLVSAGVESEGGRDMYWIMLTSIDAENKSSISVLISAEQAKQIDHFGRYGVTGTTLQVRGTYHQACAEHEGLPDIHATTASATARGVEQPDVFRLADFAPGAVAVLLGIALLGIYYWARERSR